MLQRISIVIVLILAAALPQAAQDQQSSEVISIRDRVMTATKIYQQITTFYPELSRKQWDQDYYEYLNQILAPSYGRKEFDLASMALVATLHDGHTWFYDNWIGQNYGQPIGFQAYPFDAKWVVIDSSLDSISVGDVIEAIDETPTQKYFENSRRYISASSGRDAGVSFFDTPVWFPERFTLTLDGGRRVIVDRKKDQKRTQSLKTDGKWLVPGSVAYIKVPIFHGLETQVAALDFLKQFHDAGTVILDLRGNPGAGDPGILQRSLFDKPYPMWSEHSAMHGGSLLRAYNIAYPETTHVATSDSIMRPRDQAAYTGRLIILIDRRCSCACEDFVMPFKVTRRAQLIGETTAGTFSFTNSTQFENGMRLNVASVRHTFPDGSRFEGVGIAPDVEVNPTPQSLKAGKDVVLERALAVAAQK